MISPKPVLTKRDMFNRAFSLWKWEKQKQWKKLEGSNPTQEEKVGWWIVYNSCSAETLFFLHSNFPFTSIHLNQHPVWSSLDSCENMDNFMCLILDCYYYHTIFISKAPVALPVISDKLTVITAITLLITSSFLAAMQPLNNIRQQVNTVITRLTNIRNTMKFIGLLNRLTYFEKTFHGKVYAYITFFNVCVPYGII